jgi:hypothetical protein
LLRVKEAADAFEEREESEVVNEAELEQRLGLGGRDRKRLLDKAIRLGILVPLGKDLYEVPSPSLLATAEEVVRRGITLPHALELVEELERHARVVSQKFVKLFLSDVWKPFTDAGLPDGSWDEVADSMEQLRPLAAQALLTVYRQTLSEEVEETFTDIARRLSEGKR